MKAIDLSGTFPTLPEVLELAGHDNVILRTPEGREFVLAEIDDFAQEVALVRQHDALMRFLDERSADTTRHTLDHVKQQLGAQ